MRIIKTFFISFLLVIAVNIFASDRITHLPGLKKLSNKEYAGYLPAGKKDKLFYWFVASKQPNAPIIVWSNGGPAYSSLYGFFHETGPYAVTRKLTLRSRQHAWSRFANYLVIDQPSDVGLSNIKGNPLPLSRKQGIDQYYAALHAFLKKYPAYQHRPIILAGESYAGTYLPLLANKIVKENKTAHIKMNLKGLVLMSPWIDPEIQQSMDSTYAFQHGLITAGQKLKIDLLFQQCKSFIETQHYVKANMVCGEIDSQIHTIAQVHMANIAYCSLSSNCMLDAYLRQKSVLKAIHAMDSQKFSCWSGAVNKKYYDAIQRSVKSIYNQLLADHIRVLIFSGLNDAKDTNYLGIHKLIHVMDWPKKNEYMVAKTHVIPSVGYIKSGGGLTWVKVLNAGHMIPLDQPKVDGVVKQWMK